MGTAARPAARIAGRRELALHARPIAIVIARDLGEGVLAAACPGKAEEAEKRERGTGDERACDEPGEPGSRQDAECEAAADRCPEHEAELLADDEVVAGPARGEVRGQRRGD